MDLRKQFNKNEYKYVDILPLWQCFYDEKLLSMITSKYEKFLANKLETKFGQIDIKNIDLNVLEKNIEKEIQAILHRARYNVRYIRAFYE
jgi:hypothetical protein